jgi:TonB family protein
MKAARWVLIGVTLVIASGAGRRLGAQTPAAELVTVTRGGPVMGGVALVRFVVDTAGAVEPASVVVVSSPGPGLSERLIDHVRRLRFAPGRVQGRGARVVMQWRLSVRSG